MTKEELEKENAELEEKIGVLLSCKNCPENKGGWICVKEYEGKCLAQKIEFIKELEKEKCELLGIIQGKDKVIQELEKEIAELDCQKNRNKACYSCANATERCFKNEIGCPCEKYKSYKDENAELKGIKDIATLIRANNNTVITLMQLNNMLVSKNQQLNKAKELLTKWVELFKPKGGNILPTPIQVETEQFIREVEK